VSQSVKTSINTVPSNWKSMGKDNVEMLCSY